MKESNTLIELGEITMNQAFLRIQGKLAEAKLMNNKRQLTLWRNKLKKWQQEYGAYAPIGYTGRIVEL